MTICICGAGSLGHVIAGWTAAYQVGDVNVLSSKPSLWGDTIVVHTPEGQQLRGRISCVGEDPRIVEGADVVLLCYPGFMIEGALRSIAPYLSPKAYVGGVFCSTGFFFEAKSILPKEQPLWGFQRVPFIARVQEYGKSANLLGYKPELNVAVENVPESDKQQFAEFLSRWFRCPVHLLCNYYEASLSNSNPLLHPARLYSLFAGAHEGEAYPQQVRFYEEWSDEASQLLIEMDREFFRLLDELPVRKGFLPTILDYYESTDAASLTRKISSIAAFKGIMAPMVRREDGMWVPDYASRYFTEDFPYGLRYIRDLAVRKGVQVPRIEEVFRWGMSKISR